MSITITATYITCHKASILFKSPLPSPSRLTHILQLRSYNSVHHHRHHVYHMHYSFDPITMSITSITIAIRFNTSITTSILKQCPSPLSASPSSLSRALQLRSYNNLPDFHHHRHHVYHMHYSLNPITMSITIAITSIICITASIL